LDQVDDSLEWRSVLEALRTIPAAAPRATLRTRGVIAYTDGACIKNPGGPAGWSVILMPTNDEAVDSVGIGGIGDTANKDAPRIECFGHIPKSPTTTNNRAEISAVLAALCLAPQDIPLTIYSDSEYTIKVAQGTYQMKANTDLWAMYRMLLNRRKVAPTFIWVRGHAGHALNERADELAGLGAWNGDLVAYQKWQASTAPEAHNAVSSPELTTLRQQAQLLKTLFDSIDTASSRVSPQERSFVTDMAKRLQKNNFTPTPKQVNWLKGLVAKYKV